MMSTGRTPRQIHGQVYDDHMNDHFVLSNDNEMDLSTPTQSAKKRKRNDYLPDLTIPMSPNFATSRRGKHEYEGMTSEQLRLIQLQESQEKFRQERERAQLRKQQALYGAPMMPIRSEKPLTEPQEFSFATNSRFGPKVVPTHQTPQSATKRQQHSEHRSTSITIPEPFHLSTSRRSQSLLPEETPPSNKKRKISEDRSIGITIPEPFHLSSSRSVSSESDYSHQTPSKRTSYSSSSSSSSASKPTASPFIPLAQKVRLLQSATPEHWKKNPKPPSPHRPLVLTRPVEPNLSTAHRSKPIQVPESPSVNSRTFKAVPLNRKIFESSGDLGVLRVQKRPLTQPMSPKLRVNALAARRPSVDEIRQKEEEERRKAMEFKARPITITEAPFRPSLELKITQPVSPKLRVDALAARRPSISEIKQKEEEERKKAAQFRARPLPVHDMPFRPHLELKVTQPMSPKLRVDALASRRPSISELKEKEEQERKKAAEFKARPMPSLERPFRPLLELKVTEPHPFHLNSQNRAQFRESFEDKKRMQELANKELEERRAALEAERQKAEIKKLRQKLVHKALPIPETLSKPPPPIRASCQPLTEPKTPKFHTTKRLRPAVN